MYTDQRARQDIYLSLYTLTASTAGMAIIRVGTVDRFEEDIETAVNNDNVVFYSYSTPNIQTSDINSAGLTGVTGHLAAQYILNPAVSTIISPPFLLFSTLFSCFLSFYFCQYRVSCLCSGFLG